ncbi:MAG: molybdopterin-dependent oxidoreductase [Acidobacteria bacterium]|nr:molybdopterin-dependent oxidoreductase [Acidobacteriota bacterium]
MVIQLTVNGTEVEVADDHPHLLSALRDELGLTAAKDGCAPSGQCGCCTVIVNGKARVACQTSMEKAVGAEILTLEGFDPEERERLANAFACAGALQCGFCTPGILVRTKALLDQKGSALERKSAAARMGAHLCRCTGYNSILDAIDNLAAGEIGMPALSSNIGGSGAKYEATELALGDRGYVDDMFVPGMLHGALRLTDHSRADVLSIDTSAALAIEGVEAVFTGADVPGELFVGIIYQDWPVFIPVGGRTSYYGDVLAIIVADTARTARKAAALVEVEYNVLDPIVDPAVAVDSDDIAVWKSTTNTLSVSEYSRGDFASAFEASPHKMSERFITQRVEHAFLEPESTLAVPGDEGLLVYSGGQGVWDDRNQIAAILGVETSEVTVELVSNGGAFGGKEDMSNQGQTALAAHLLGRPVKCTLTREESLRMHPKRHPITIDLDVSCDEDGRLTALRARMLGDSGPYASVGMKVLERAAGHASGPYVVDNIDVRAVAVRTNNPVCGAFRGFGANQAQFAMEGALDRLAEMVGIDRLEIRKRNAIFPGAIWGPGQRMDDGSAGVLACIEAVQPAYDEAMAAGKAVGIGVALKNSGLGNGFIEIAKAVIRYNEDGSIDVRHCWTEMGQGVNTIALQVASEELEVDPERIRVIVDTTRELGAGQTTGSRGTLMAAGSIEAACKEAIGGGREIGVDYEGEYRVDWTNSLGEKLENPIIHSAFGYAAQVVIADRETGEIEKVVAAHDVGRAINPQLCKGQVEGSVHMGLGYALSEDFPTDELGRPTNMTLRSLNILRAKDMPEVETILIEVPQPRSPYGIKGVGEIGLVPTAGAVAGAMKMVDGQWRNRLPIRTHQPIGFADAGSP